MNSCLFYLKYDGVNGFYVNVCACSCVCMHVLPVCLYVCLIELLLMHVVF